MALKVDFIVCTMYIVHKSSKESHHNILHKILGGSFAYMEKTTHFFHEFSLIFNLNMLLRQKRLDSSVQNIRNHSKT